MVWKKKYYKIILPEMVKILKNKGLKICKLEFFGQNKVSFVTINIFLAKYMFIYMLGKTISPYNI